MSVVVDQKTNSVFTVSADQHLVTAQVAEAAVRIAELEVEINRTAAVLNNLNALVDTPWERESVINARNACLRNLDNSCQLYADVTARYERLLKEMA